MLKIQVFIVIIVLVFYVVGNKNDLFSQAVVSEEEGRRFAEKINALFTLTSSLTGEGIKEIFEEIEQTSNLVSLEFKDFDRISLDDAPEKEKDNCCSSGHQTKKSTPKIKEVTKDTSKKDIVLPLYPKTTESAEITPNKEKLLQAFRKEYEINIPAPTKKRCCCFCCCKKKK